MIQNLIDWHLHYLLYVIDLHHWLTGCNNKMAAGGRLMHEARAERLLLKILPEVSMTEEADRSPSPPPFKVPDGLRTLLNELSKEVNIVLDKYWYKNYCNTIF